MLSYIREINGRTKKHRISVISVFFRQFITFMGSFIILAINARLLGLEGVGAVALWTAIVALPNVILDAVNQTTARSLSAIKGRKQLHQYVTSALALTIFLQTSYTAFTLAYLSSANDQSWVSNFLFIDEFSFFDISYMIFSLGILKAINSFGAASLTGLKEILFLQAVQVFKIILTITSLSFYQILFNGIKIENLQFVVTTLVLIEAMQTISISTRIYQIGIRVNLNSSGVLSYLTARDHKILTGPSMITSSMAIITKRISLIIVATVSEPITLGTYSIMIQALDAFNKFPINFIKIFIGHYKTVNKSLMQQKILGYLICATHGVVGILYLGTSPLWLPLFKITSSHSSVTLALCASLIIIITGYSNSSYNQLLINGNTTFQLFPAALRNGTFLLSISILNNTEIEVMLCMLLSAFASSIGYFSIFKLKNLLLFEKKIIITTASAIGVILIFTLLNRNFF